MNKENLPHEVRSFLDAIENHPDMVYRIFGSLEDMGISDASEYADERLAYFAYLRAMMGANQYPLKSTQSYLLKPLSKKKQSNMSLTQTVMLDISCKCFNCDDEYFGSNMTVVDDFDPNLEKYGNFNEIKIYSEKLLDTYGWCAPIYVEIRRRGVSRVAIPRHRTLFGYDVPVYVVTHDDTLIVAFKNPVCGVYVEVNLPNLLKYRYDFVKDTAVVLHKASSSGDDLSEFHSLADSLYRQHPVAIELGQNHNPDKVMVRVFPVDNTHLFNTHHEHRKGVV